MFKVGIESIFRFDLDPENDSVVIDDIDRITLLQLILV